MSRSTCRRWWSGRLDLHGGGRLWWWGSGRLVDRRGAFGSSASPVPVVAVAWLIGCSSGRKNGTSITTATTTSPPPPQILKLMLSNMALRDRSFVFVLVFLLLITHASMVHCRHLQPRVTVTTTTTTTIGATSYKNTVGEGLEVIVSSTKNDNRKFKMCSLAYKLASGPSSSSAATTSSPSAAWSARLHHPLHRRFTFIISRLLDISSYSSSPKCPIGLSLRCPRIVDVMR
ncbi:hypothetical protein E3N88_23292 [Mikania micrantha]|uniref:Uncharacterized protein n=1 Tax=Mikania micrantha TaxID=192012 RepID=A0A5N6NCW5_9ASTR|nr:hypothetical protein E3N88_23292 [Mikania micrantha]